MKILEINKIQRAEDGLYYRRKFDADVSAEISAIIIQFPIRFIIETGPLGNKDLDIDFIEAPNYPVLPLKKALSEMILSMDSEGQLP